MKILRLVQRIARRALLAGLSLPAAAIAQPMDRPLPQAFREHLLAFDQAVQWRRYEEGYEHALQAAEAMPGWGTPEYNVACAAAGSKRTAIALTWLQKAIDCGYEDPRRTRYDADLRILRRLEEFELIYAQADMQSKMASAIHRPSSVITGQPVPLLVVLHNFGGNPWAVMNQWKECAGEVKAVILAPKAPGVISASQRRWLSAKETEQIVSTQMEEIATQYPIDCDRIVLVGLGQGGEMGYSLIRSEPEKFAGLICVAGHFPEEPRFSNRAEDEPRFSNRADAGPATDSPRTMNPAAQGQNGQLPRFCIMVG